MRLGHKSLKLETYMCAFEAAMILCANVFVSVIIYALGPNQHACKQQCANILPCMVSVLLEFMVQTTRAPM
jgi:hypothetical protein